MEAAVDEPILAHLHTHRSSFPRWCELQYITQTCLLLIQYQGVRHPHHEMPTGRHRGWDHESLGRGRMSTLAATPGLHTMSYSYRGGVWWDVMRCVSHSMKFEAWVGWTEREDKKAGRKVGNRRSCSRVLSATIRPLSRHAIIDHWLREQLSQAWWVVGIFCPPQTAIGIRELVPVDYRRL